MAKVVSGFKPGSVVMALVGMLFIVPIVCGQVTSVSSATAFEVASLKTSPPSDAHVWQITGGPGTKSPSRFSSSNAPLRALLLKAYGLQPWQLVGPDSLDSDKVDIEAKIPEGSSKDQV